MAPALNNLCKKSCGKAWFLSVTYGVLPVIEVGNMKYAEEYSTTPLPADAVANRKYTVGLAAGLQIALLVIQFVSFVLYVPIFVVVKISGANVGARREATLAREILSSTRLNKFDFLLVPVIIGAFQNQMSYEASLGRYTFKELQWLRFVIMIFPMFCFSRSQSRGDMLQGHVAGKNFMRCSHEGACCGDMS